MRTLKSVSCQWWSNHDVYPLLKSQGDKGISRISMSHRWLSYADSGVYPVLVSRILESIFHWWWSNPGVYPVLKSRGDKGIPRTSMSHRWLSDPNIHPVFKSRGDKGIPKTCMSRQRQLHVSPNVYPIFKSQRDKEIPRISMSHWWLSVSNVHSVFKFRGD